MGLNCGESLAKILLVAFNIVFWLSGLALLILGIIMVVKPDIVAVQKILSEADPSFQIAAYILIGIGVFIFVVGFCGCCGALKENQCLLGMYIFFLVVVLAAELGVGIFVAVKTPEVKKNIIKVMKEIIRDEYPSESQDNEENSVKKLVDEYQKQLKCCGVQNKTDWLDTNWYKNQSDQYQIPQSCCDTEVSLLECNNSTSIQFNQPCYDALVTWISDNFPIVIGVGCGIAGLEVIGLICALCLCCAVRRNNDSKYS